VLPYLRRDLTVSHLIDRLDPDNPLAKVVFLEALLQLAFGLARSEDENGFCTANGRNHRIVVGRQMPLKPFLLAIVCWDLL
jgi:hypothetical protein